MSVQVEGAAVDIHILGCGIAVECHLSTSVTIQNSGPEVGPFFSGGAICEVVCFSEDQTGSVEGRSGPVQVKGGYGLCSVQGESAVDVRYGVVSDPLIKPKDESGSRVHIHCECGFVDHGPVESHGAAPHIHSAGEGVATEEDGAITVQDSVAEVGAFFGHSSISEIVGLGVYESGSSDDAAGLKGGDSLCSVEVQDAAWITSVARFDRQGGRIRDALKGSESEFATCCDRDISVCGSGQGGGAATQDGKIAGEGVVPTKDDVPGAG